MTAQGGIGKMHLPVRAAGQGCRSGLLDTTPNSGPGSSEEKPGGSEGNTIVISKTKQDNGIIPAQEQTGF